MENTNNNLMSDDRYDLDPNFDYTNFLGDMNTDNLWNTSGEQPAGELPSTVQIQTRQQVSPLQAPRPAFAQHYTGPSSNGYGNSRQPSYGQAHAELLSNSYRSSRQPSMGHSLEQILAGSSNMGYGISDQPALTINTFKPMPSNHIGNYTNPVFYGFSSPIVPLSVIDQYFSRGLPRDLSANLGVQLQADLANQQWARQRPSKQYQAQSCPKTPLEVDTSTVASERTSRQLREVEEESEPDSPVAPKQIKATKTTNKRSENRVNFDPTTWYTPRASTPESWGPINTNTGKHLFRYTAKGELTPFDSFTPKDLMHFLTNHPLNFEADRETRKPDMKKTGLICWIQSVPADSKARYGHPYSSLCRFSNCTNHRRTIAKGDFRIAFDEHSYADMPGQVHDPFHVAAYVHLSCFERFMNFPKCARKFDFRPDFRNLPEGKNRMAITRDHFGMKCVVEKYLAEFTWEDKEKFAQSEETGEFYRPAGTEWYKHSLNYTLTKTHIDNQPPAKVIDRVLRASNNSIQIHMNDLEVYMFNKMAELQKKRAATRKVKGKKVQAPKRKITVAPEDSDDKSVLDDEIFHERPAKRVKPTRSSRSGKLY